MQGFLRALRLSRLFAVTAITLGVTYFSFQAELFEEEFEAAHPAPCSGWSVSAISITWETFDKDNAVAAFVVVVDHAVRPLMVLDEEAPPSCVIPPHVHPVRDKSPPFA